VFVYYLNGSKPEKQILRNSMKSIEKQFENSSFKRCHRSFMVNLQKIEFVDYGKSQCRVKLSGLEKFIPVSRKFYPGFRSFTKS
jgi:DNA-binding LytR/AlgR family response regulator